MIKLNNKNITYVALADSNNSTIGVKEIWYADTNNSVKLVYRRKDALIEGVDYEKYHWLVGDSNADFNAYLSYNVIQYSLSAINPYAVLNMCNFNGGGAFQFVMNDWHNPSSTKNIGIYDNQRSNWYNVPMQDVNTIKIDSTSNTNNIVVNDVDISNPNKIPSNVIPIIDIVNADGLKVSAITINATNKLVPCKLLKPVPKWLDANGIRRQVGECGMIDLISGKFYGNVNSVGTFTVENYYERKEWLVGDGDANISGTLICTNYLEWKLAQYSGQYVALNYGELSDNSHQFQLSVNSNATNTIGVFFNDTHKYVSLSQQSVNDIKFLVNSQVIGIINNVNIENNNSNLKFNGKISLNLIAKSGGISKITVDNKERYIPCTLTMDLPASMDANNIARTKGTSGMWDLVSDRFYGNVANSGTFKAVNLAEGVDYEVHQWLKVSVSTKADMAALPVDSTNLYFKHKHISGKNYHYFRATDDGVDYEYYYASDVYRCAIWNTSNRIRVYSTQDIIEDEIVINCNSSNRYVNGYDIPIYGSTIKQVSIISKDQSGFEGLISTITVDGVERYIPVKLLRSIPSKYDANGIARQAGECGMYDTVNDKFYGNVASRGSFTVSDDN